MELRNHPIMLCDGVRTRPPKWSQLYGPSNRSVAGEVGVLSAVFLSSTVPPDKVNLVIMTANGNCYLGKLMFEKHTSRNRCVQSAEQIFPSISNRATVRVRLWGMVC